MTIAKAVIEFADGNREHAIKAASGLCTLHTIIQEVDIYMFVDKSVLYIGEDAMVYNDNEYLYKDGQ